MLFSMKLYALFDYALKNLSIHKSFYLSFFVSTHLILVLRVSVNCYFYVPFSLIFQSFLHSLHLVLLSWYLKKRLRFLVFVALSYSNISTILSLLKYLQYSDNGSVFLFSLFVQILDFFRLSPSLFY